jgi:hypothetical protein
MNISVRHFSVPLILVTLMLAAVPASIAYAAPAGRTAGTIAAVGLSGACVYSAVAAYPFYIPYVNPLSLGRPVHELLNDSNVDWNQALPEVARFAEAQQLSDVPFDAYGFSRLTPWLPKARYWNCQRPTAQEAGRWVIVSANMMLDSHNCVWLLRYPRETLGGGSVYAFRLPEVIPPAGEPGGPPRPESWHQFPTQRGGGARDLRAVMTGAIEAPETIPDIIRQMQEEHRQRQAVGPQR